VAFILQRKMSIVSADLDKNLNQPVFAAFKKIYVSPLVFGGMLKE